MLCLGFIVEDKNNKKYRYTKQLINMALRDGWTQKQIADTCRTQQSVVSAWKSGASQAKENQLKTLLETFGPRLVRKTFKIYHNFCEDGKNNYLPKMIKVEGEVILNFPYQNKSFCMKCSSESKSCSCGTKINKINRMIPNRRIIIHAMGKGDFCLLKQVRLIKAEFQMQFPETNIFNSAVIGRFTAQELLGEIGTLEKINGSDEKMRAEEHLMLQMLSRKSLLEHGYPVEGLEEHLVSW